jgi:uncharacterized protein (TIGR02301 family)
MTFEARMRKRPRAVYVAILCASTCIGAVVSSPAWAQFPFDIFGFGSQRQHAPVMRERQAPRPKARRNDAKRKRDAAKNKPGQTKSGEGAAGGPEAPPPPYEPQMTRLAEILGALSFLRSLCGDKDGGEWRAKMSALLDAEAQSGTRRQKLTSAFNRGFHGYELTYRNCTPNARLAISRYLDEGSRLTHDITYRYGNQ